MTIQTSTNRVVMTGIAGAPAFDSDKNTFTPTDTKTGTIVLPDFSMSLSAATITTVDTSLGSVNASANAVLGVMTTTARWSGTVAQPIGGTITLWRLNLAMNDDSLARNYVTRTFGVDVFAGILTGTFLVESSALVFRRRLFMPTNGFGGGSFVSIPSITINYQALVGVI